MNDKRSCRTPMLQHHDALDADSMITALQTLWYVLRSVVLRYPAASGPSECKGFKERYRLLQYHAIKVRSRGGRPRPH